jgi:hypothetical protein
LNRLYATMTEDVSAVASKYPMAAIALFGSGFILAAFSLIVTVGLYTRAYGTTKTSCYKRLKSVYP